MTPPDPTAAKLFKLLATTSIYLVARADFAVSTLAAGGVLECRRAL